MSEVLRESGEQKIPSVELEEHANKNLEQLEKKALEAADAKQEVAEIQQFAKEEAISGKEVSLGSSEYKKPVNSYTAHRELKELTFQRTLNRIQSRLKAPGRIFSKVTHQPIVDKASAIAASSVGRASGLLGAGLLGFIGSSLLLYAARRYGISYSYTSVIALFLIGYVIGALTELVYKSIKRSRR